MNIKAVIIAACLAVATPAAAQSRGEVITPNFERAIPNIPGKSLVAVVVDYAPGGASQRRASRVSISRKSRKVQSRIA